MTPRCRGPCGTSPPWTDAPRQIAKLILQTERRMIHLEDVFSWPVNAGPAMRASTNAIFLDHAGAAGEQKALTDWRQVPLLVPAAIKKVHETHSRAPYKDRWPDASPTPAPTVSPLMLRDCSYVSIVNSDDGLRADLPRRFLSTSTSKMLSRWACRSSRTSSRTCTISS